MYWKRTWFKDNRSSIAAKTIKWISWRKFFCPFGIGKIYSIIIDRSLFQNEIINSVKYWNQLDKLKDAYSRKTAKIGEPTRPSRQCKIAYYINYKRKVVTIWYHIFCIILYSDFALSDLFLSLKNSFHDKRFQSVNKKNASQVYFANKPQKKEIMRLPKKGRRR